MPLAIADALRRFESWLRVEKNLSPRTRTAYVYDLKRFAESLPGALTTRVEAISSLEIKVWIQHLREDLHYRPTTLARSISSIRVFFEFLVEQNNLEVNPAEGIHTPRQPRKLPIYLVEGELRRLFDAPDRSTPQGLRDRAMLILFAFGGIRLQELVGLDLLDLDFASQTIKVFGKGSKERLLPMNPDVEAALRAWLLVREADGAEKAVFINRFGHRLSGRMIEKIVQKYVVQAGISKEHLSPHKLRHTFATMLHSRDVDLVEIQTLLGHSTLSTTQIYTHTNSGRLQAAVDRLEVLAVRDDAG